MYHKVFIKEIYILIHLKYNLNMNIKCIQKVHSIKHNLNHQIIIKHLINQHINILNKNNLNKKLEN